MLDEKYIISLIDSAKKYVHKLQYLADNNKSTLKAINTLKMLHQIYQWANFRGEKEEFKQELRELMHCIITGNSNLVLPEIIPGPEYSNVNTPQTIYTWQDVYGNVKPYEPVTTGTIRINKIVTVDGEAITDNTTFTVNITNGATVLTRTVSRNSPLILLELPFGTYTITEVPLEGYDLVSITPSIVTLSELNLSAIVNITNELFVEKFGTLMINKIVTVDNLPIDDDTTFTVGIDNGETTLYRTFSQNSALLLDELPLGTYSITEISLVGYDLTSIVPSSVTFTESNLEIIVDITNELYVEKFGNITINKVVRKDSIVIDDNAAFGLEIIGPLGTSYEMFSQNSPLVLTNVKLGEYTINEIYNVNYIIDSITPSTFTLTPTTSEQIVTITNDVCVEEVDCECVVSFSYYEENSISVLSVGDLLGTPCVLDEYVIDWYRDGVHAMVSGSGNDPEIETFHPFIGIEAVPVLAGEWVPVVRYIIVNGTKIYSTEDGAHDTCSNWCSSLINLPVIIVVSPLNCDSVSSPLPTPYNYRLSYSSSQDYNLASRTVQFMLPDDLSAKYFACEFTGFNVADRVQFYFNDTPTILADWTIGTRYVSSNTFTVPTSVSTYSQKFVFELPTYISGDYLIIKITPSVLENNPRTDWQLSMKCLDNSYIFDCDLVPYDRIISNISIANNIENCRWEVSASVLNSLGYTAGNPLYNFYIYGGLSVQSTGTSLFNHDTKQVLLYLQYGGIAKSLAWSYAGSTSFVDCSGLLTVSKVGNVLTFVCENSIDYNAFVDGYTYSSTVPSSFSDAYSVMVIFMRFRDGGCGDGFSSVSYYIHTSSSVVFSGGNTITITLAEAPYIPTSPTCVSTSTTVNSYATAANNFISSDDFTNLTTMCRMRYPLGYGMGMDGTTNKINTSKVFGTREYYINGNLTTPCSSLSGFTANGNVFVNAIYGLEAEITATKDGNGDYIEDPSLNYKVYSRIGDDGLLKPTNQRLLYEVVAGVVITNILPHY